MIDLVKLAIDGKSLELVVGDITEQRVDAMVNAANAMLRVGGGVDGAIHRRGGGSILEETRQKYPRGCPTGSAVISGAGKLPCKFVIHAVGPVWQGNEHEASRQLESAYRSALELAGLHQCHTVAFPALSCGAYGFPIGLAAEIALTTVKNWLMESEYPGTARFVLFDQLTFAEFADVLQRISQ